MSKASLKLSNLHLGGIADSKYVPSSNSVAQLVGMDLNRELGTMVANQNMKALNPLGAPTELPVKELVLENGDMYYFDSESGKIWKLNQSNEFQLVYTTVPISGSDKILDAIVYSDYMYWTTENYIHRIRISKIDNCSENAEANWMPLTLDQPLLGFDTDSIGYAVPISPHENADNTRFFKPIENSLSGINIKINSPGINVNLTIVVHDSNNVELGSSTILSTKVKTNAMNFFAFIDQISLDPDQTYHFHVIGNVLGAFVGTQIAVSPTIPTLTNAITEIHTLSTPLAHSFAISNLVLYIGDRNYVDQIEADPRNGEHVFSYFALDVPRDYTITAMVGWETNLVLGASGGGAVSQSHVYWWNTFSTISFDYDDFVPETMIYSFLVNDNRLYVSAGDFGRIYQYYQGVLQWSRQIPGIFDNLNQGHIDLNASCFFHNRLLFGFSATKGDPCITGVYSVSQPRPDKPFVLNFEYPISKRNGEEFLLHGIHIAAITTRNDDLLITWQNNFTGEVGNDIIDWENKMNNAEIITGVIKLYGDVDMFMLRKIVVDYAELPDCCGIEIDYFKNFSEDPTTQETKNDPTRLQQILQTSDNCIAIQARIRLKTKGNDSPKIFGIYFGLN